MNKMTNTLIHKAAILLPLLTLGLVHSVDAKPMPAPTPQEAARSPLIVVCEYIDYDKDGPVTYFGGVIARYKVTSALKGQAAGDTVKIRYTFHDGTPCMETPGWTFDEKTMPKPGSRWILFLSPGAKADDPCTTYRGNYGRWPATPETLKRVEDLLGAAKAKDK